MTALPATLKSWRSRGRRNIAIASGQGASAHTAAFGVYYIAGNHEEFYRNAEYLPPLLRAGIQVLDNEKAEVDGLQLIGVHYGDASPSRTIPRDSCRA